MSGFRQKKVAMSEAKSDENEEPSKKLNDDFKFQRMKDAKSEVLTDFCCSVNPHQFGVKLFCSTFISAWYVFLEPSIIHVIFLNRTVRIVFALGIFCMLLPIVDYFYFYSNEITEYQVDDSGICSHYPIYQIPCGSEVSDFHFLLWTWLFISDVNRQL